MGTSSTTRGLEFAQRKPERGLVAGEIEPPALEVVDTNREEHGDATDGAEKQEAQRDKEELRSRQCNEAHARQAMLTLARSAEHRG